MPHINDRAAKDFIIALDKMRAEIVAEFIKLSDSVSVEQLRQIIATKTRDFVLTDPKFAKSFNSLIGVYGESLDGIKAFATVSNETLQSLINIDQANWVARFEIEISAIQKEIFNASLTNQWNQKLIINNLKNGVHGNLSEGQINTLVDTSLSTFERNVTTAMMGEMPEDTKYVYVGPLDELTRDICNTMIGAGELTEAEIISQFGAGVLQFGGGFNCRHRWTL